MARISRELGSHLNLEPFSSVFLFSPFLLAGHSQPTAFMATKSTKATVAPHTQVSDVSCWLARACLRRTLGSLIVLSSYKLAAHTFPRSILKASLSLSLAISLSLSLSLSKLKNKGKEETKHTQGGFEGKDLS